MYHETEHEYYISSGLGHKMYTLRSEWTSTYNDVSYQRSRHIRNLSTDLEKAKAKAAELGYNIIRVGAPSELDQIVQRTAEELAEIERKKEARIQAEWDEYVQVGNDKIRDQVDGFWGLGKHKGKRVDIDDPKQTNYIDWWLTRKIESDSDDERQRRNDEVAIAIQDILRKQFAERYQQVISAKLSLKGNGKYFGEIKKRYNNIDVTFLKSAGYSGYYGDVYIETFVTDDGEILVYKGGTAFMFEVGEKYNLSFSVKEHSIYKDVHQTSILRLKIPPTPTQKIINKIEGLVKNTNMEEVGCILINEIRQQISLSYDDFINTLQDLIRDSDKEEWEDLDDLIYSDSFDMLWPKR